MRQAKYLVPLLVAWLLTSCGGGPEECNDKKRYQEAREGERIVVPEGLDDLETGKELKIPEPNPQSPTAGGAGCLDRPPGSYSTGEG